MALLNPILLLIISTLVVCCHASVPQKQKHLSKSSSVENYEIRVENSVLVDLQSRLTNTNFVRERTHSLRNQEGVDMTYMNDIVLYWKNSFDWRAQEQKLNQLPQYTAIISGLKLHFVHARSKSANATPIMMLHGWPSTAFEFSKIIPLLTSSDFGERDSEESEAFHVVCPSLPGYFVSQTTQDESMTTEKMAIIFDELMRALGYSRYIVYGGDWGSMIGTKMALYDETKPKEERAIMGLYLTSMLALIPPVVGSGILTSLSTVLSLLFPSFYFDDYEKFKWDRVMRTVLFESGYFLEQSTKPQTLGMALENSPVGLAAWILEKYSTWSDSSDGYHNQQVNSSAKVSREILDMLQQKWNYSLHNAENSFQRDDLLTCVMLYWCSNSLTTSVRLYYDTFQGFRNGDPLQWKIETPTAFADFPVEFLWAPQRWAKSTYTNLLQWTQMPSGGHFPALEKPELLAADIKAFQVKLRTTEAERVATKSEEL